MENLELIDRLRREPRYTLAEAARLTEVHPSTLRAWLAGTVQRPAVLTREFSSDLRLSFLDLCEVVVVRGFREGRDGVARLPLERLRRAHAFASERLRIEHPFASQHLFTDGVNILHDFEGENPGPGRLVLDLDGQFALPFAVGQLRAQFEFDVTLAQLATRWFPAGRDGAIVVDPARAAGMPIIVGRNLRVDFIAQRFKRGGESIESIARDLDLEPVDVEAAIRFAA